MVLCTAVKKGSLKIVENLLQYCANVNVNNYSRFEFGGIRTPLHIAVKDNSVEMAILLINYGANVNVRDGEGLSPIVYAIENNDTEMTVLLLTNLADIKDNPNLLCAAVEKGNLEIVEDLLEYGADVNVKDDRGAIPIVCSILTNNREMTELVLTNGADLKDHSNLLCDAVVGADLKIVAGLLRQGADINASDCLGRTALHYTILDTRDNERRLTSFNGYRPVHKKIVELLLHKGANVNVKTKSGITTLSAASRKGYKDIVEILLKYGAECNPGAEEDIKPLHVAAVRNHWEIVEYLLKFGAEVDSRDMYGRTALHLASRQGHTHIVRTLLNYGSDVNIISNKDHTPLEYVRIDGQDEISYDRGNDYYDYYFSNINVFNLISQSWYSITMLLKQHIAKLKAAGLHVSERNLLSISNNDAINNFLNICEAEIEVMKSEKIDDIYASFYNILTKNPSQFAKNESIVQALKSNDYKRKFPIYASMIDSRFRMGIEREKLLKQVWNKFLHSRCESLSELPLLCTEKIFSYLSDQDLRISLAACKP